MPSHLELPTEIWIYIASLLSSNDLTCLCRASTLHLSIVYPILYRSVSLPGVEATFKTFSLLSSNKSLAEHILELTIRPPEFKFESNLLKPLLEVLPLLTKMKKFTVVGGSFFPRGQERFLEVMKEKNPPLEEFSYIEHTTSISAGELLDLSTFTGLRKMSWSIRTGIYMNRWAPNIMLQQVLSASIESIESITIDHYLGDLDFLWEMQFPSLKRLDVGSVLTFAEELHYSLSEFLNGHPGIEELHIGPNIYDDENAFLWQWENLTTSNPDHIYPDLLATLRSYKGSIEGFISIFSWRSFCLGDNLEELVFELDEGYFEDLGSKIGTLNKVFLRSREVLETLRLKKLEFPLMPFLHTTLADDGLPFQHADYSWFPTLLDDGLEFARLCAPSLEYYRGPIPKTYDDLIPFLTLFPKLKQLYVCAHHVWGRQIEKLEGNARIEGIAGICEFLEKIVIISDDSDSDVICWKEVLRKRPGNKVLRIETHWQTRMS